MSYCSYSECKAVAEFDTPLGLYCPYHFKVIKRKKNITNINWGKRIKMTNTEKKLLKVTRLNPRISIKLNKGGQNEKNTRTRQKS